ncbi:NADPH:quinone reductase-like Zn-dependent oxidoreductase [Planomicrobium koreense]|uniref:NADPH:quinone reductase-like Zn-dependent oxidoreductase n=1 Tax=Planococcus koreensis TaxID=112331 RepID=A0A7W8FTI6_9BACL|nr:NADPH:quinone reductase-like Zn-dependent oxidoreductase [Planococcus koreensis]
MKPANLTFEEAAAIPLVGLTSYQALHDILQIKAGEKVLIHAGSGGVGTFAIQLAKSMGATVATTASDGSLLVKTLGADRVINYKEEKFEDVLHEYDAVLDTIGGASLEKSFAILKEEGRLVSVSGTPTGRFAEENGLGIVKKILFSLASAKLMKLARKNNVQYTFLFMKPSGEQLQVLTKLLEAEKIKPVIDTVFSFEDAQKALAYLEKGKAKGKIIIKMK